LISCLFDLNFVPTFMDFQITPCLFRRGGVVFLTPLFSFSFLSLWVVSPLAFADRLGF